MSVLSCSRPSCSSIMCDTYVDSVGYVCLDCQVEFKEYLKTLNSYPINEGEILKELKYFMDTDKGQFKQGVEMSVEAFFTQRSN